MPARWGCGVGFYFIKGNSKKEDMNTAHSFRATNLETNPTTPPEGVTASLLPPAQPRLSPAALAHLEDARVRLAQCDRHIQWLDTHHAKLVALNVALSATPVGEAWHAVKARAEVWRLQVLREINAVLDGDLAEAEGERIWSDRMARIVTDYLNALADETERLVVRD